MKADIKKKIEIGLWACNLMAFIMVNLFLLRTFHWVATFIMIIPLTITILFAVRNNYVDWEKKSPSILQLLISFGIYVVSEIIMRLSVDANSTIYVLLFITRFLSAVLSSIFFIRFMIIYNKAFRIHRNELNLNPQEKQRLYNLSIPVLFVFILLLVWLITVSFIDKFATVNSPAKYEMAIAESDYDFFPDSLPANAKNEEFCHYPGFWLAKSKAYVKFETTKEYLKEYELLHRSDVTKVTSIDVWLERHIESDVVCKRINDNYINKENCDVYIKAEGFSIQGYVVNRNNNELFIFYDGFD